MKRQKECCVLNKFQSARVYARINFEKTKGTFSKEHDVVRVRKTNLFFFNLLHVCMSA